MLQYFGSKYINNSSVVSLGFGAAIAKVRQSLTLTLTLTVTLTLYHSGPSIWRPFAMAGRYRLPSWQDHDVVERGLSNDPRPLTHGGIAAGVFLVQYTLYYKKSKELQLAHAAFPHGGPEIYHNFCNTKCHR